MSSSSLELPRDLGNGLILRRSTPADAEPLADFNKMIFREPPATEPDEFVAAWTRDLLNGSHPTFGVDDCTIVEEAATGRIVSSMNLISQTWTYDGIPFGVGRPELVGTEPEYRKRGLVRAQFEVMHALSAQRGEMVQAITGIPYYYRQFGYEMAMGLGGGRQGNAANVAKLKDGEVEPFRLRAAVETDLPFVLELDAHAARQNLVYCTRDESLWRYELWGKSEKNGNRLDWFIVETAAGEAVGLLGSSITLWGTRLGINYFELKPGVSWLQVAPSVLRGVKAIGEALAARENKTLTDLYLLPRRRPPVLPHHPDPAAGGEARLRVVPARARPARLLAPCRAGAGAQAGAVGGGRAYRRAQAELLPGGAAAGVRGRAAGGHRALDAGARR